MGRPLAMTGTIEACCRAARLRHSASGSRVPAATRRGSIASRTRVRFLVDPLEPLTVEMSVDLCGGDVRVTQHSLHRSEVRPMLEQVGGEAVAYHMRAQAGPRDAGLAPVPLDALPEGLPCEPAAAHRDEDALGGPHATRSRPQQIETGALQIGLHDAPGLDAHRDDSLLG